jgi:hypothetical protein
MSDKFKPHAGYVPPKIPEHHETGPKTREGKLLDFGPNEVRTRTTIEKRRTGPLKPSEDDLFAGMDVKGQKRDFRNPMSSRELGDSLEIIKEQEGKAKYETWQKNVGKPGKTNRFDINEYDQSLKRNEQMLEPKPQWPTRALSWLGSKWTGLVAWAKKLFQPSNKETQQLEKEVSELEQRKNMDGTKERVQYNASRFTGVKNYSPDIKIDEKEAKKIFNNPEKEDMFADMDIKKHPDGKN